MCIRDSTSTVINNLFFSSSIQTVLTSATLTNTQDGEMEEQYSYFVRSTGFPLGDAGMLAEPKPSPYLYDDHALIYYCNDLPHPTKEREEFIQQGVDVYKRQFIWSQKQGTCKNTHQKNLKNPDYGTVTHI